MGAYARDGAAAETPSAVEVVVMAKCWLRDGCPCLTAACSSCQPTDDGCPVYRWFRNLFANGMVVVENMKMPENCGKCRMCAEGCGLMYCAAATDENAVSAKAVDRQDIRPEWCPLKEVREWL